MRGDGVDLGWGEPGEEGCEGGGFVDVVVGEAEEGGEG